jgi:hypothetical protein
VAVDSSKQDESPIIYPPSAKPKVSPQGGNESKGEAKSRTSIPRESQGKKATTCRTEHVPSSCAGAANAASAASTAASHQRETNVKSASVRMSTKEYQWIARRTKRRNQKAQWNRQGDQARLVQALQNCPSAKVGTLTEFMLHLKALAPIFQPIWEFRQRRRELRHRFDSYIHHQKAIDVACNRLLSSPSPPAQATCSAAAPASLSSCSSCSCSAGSSSKNKDPRPVVVAFGSARWDGTRTGYVTAPTKKICARLGTRPGVQVVGTHEQLSSQICSNCGCELHNVLREPLVVAASNGSGSGPPPATATGAGNRASSFECDEKREKKKTKGKHEAILYAVKSCQGCNTVWNRDVNAARNIRDVLVWRAQNACVGGGDFDGSERPSHLAFSRRTNKKKAGVALPPQAGPTWSCQNKKSGINKVAICAGITHPTNEALYRKGTPSDFSLRGKSYWDSL